MADIVSRIRVEAHGADQAAREIRKLKEAYDQVAQSARGLSADVGSGGRDPFSRAVAAGGGALEGGNTPADISHRESRTRLQHDLQKSRESANLNYNAGIRPQTVSQGFSTVEAAASGQGGAAASGVLGMIGGALGGALPLLAGAAAFRGVQGLSNDAYGRFSGLRNAGTPQRLGVNTFDTITETARLERSGIPDSVVNSFFSSASNSGVDLRSASTRDASRIAMVAAASMGIDPSAVAGLIGSLERAGIDSGDALGEAGGMYNVAQSSFGRANAGVFVQSLQGMVEATSGRGIGGSDTGTQALAVQMAALSQFGGMSPQAAAQFTQQLQGRGIQAAGLQSPEDIIAFQAMRRDAEPGESVTDTMIRMERNPLEVNRRVIEHLRETSGSEDDLRMRAQRYLGPNTSMDALDRFLTTGERLDQHSTKANFEFFGGDADVEALAMADPTYMAESRITGVNQAKALTGISLQVLEGMTTLAEQFLSMFGFEFNPESGVGRAFGDMDYGGRYMSDAAIDARAVEISELTNGVINADRVVVFLGEGREHLTPTQLDATTRTDEVFNIAGSQALRDNAALNSLVGHMVESSGDRNLMETFQSATGDDPAALSLSFGGLGRMVPEVALSYLTSARNEHSRGSAEYKAIDDVIAQHETLLLGSSNTMTEEAAVDILLQILQSVQQALGRPVITDDHSDHKFSR